MSKYLLSHSRSINVNMIVINYAIDNSYTHVLLFMSKKDRENKTIYLSHINQCDEEHCHSILSYYYRLFLPIDDKKT